MHILSTSFNHRRLNLFLLLGNQALLIDAGFPHTASDLIFPYLHANNIPAAQLAWLLITHASPDHFGGASNLSNAIPALKVIAHKNDADSILNPDHFLQQHINLFSSDGIRIPYPVPGSVDFRNLHGNLKKIDWIVEGNETLNLAPGWQVTVHHAPGHTPGHLVLYDQQNQTLYAGDALMGAGIPDIEGNLCMPPHYFDVQDYLNTLQLVNSLNPKILCLTHYPLIKDDKVEKFLASSQKFVQDCSDWVHDLLIHNQKPFSFRQVIYDLRSKISIPDAEYQYALLARAHIQQLIKIGEVFPLGDGRYASTQIV